MVFWAFLQLLSLKKDVQKLIWYRVVGVVSSKQTRTVTICDHLFFRQCRPRNKITTSPLVDHQIIITLNQLNKEKVYPPKKNWLNLPSVGYRLRMKIKIRFLDNKRMCVWIEFSRHLESPGGLLYASMYGLVFTTMA